MEPIESLEAQIEPQTAAENETIAQLSPEEELVVEEMIQAGVLHGRKHSRTNPKMAKYIFTTRRGIDVFDLLQTNSLLGEAALFLKEIAEKKLPLLVVCSKPALKDLVENFAKKLNLPYVTERWLGGTLTNFKTISKRIDYMKKLRSEKAKGVWEKYTKKEKLLLDRKLEKLTTLFGGIENLMQLPAALVIVDVLDHKTAVNEAARLNIPIVGMINTDGDPDKIKYPIPCNDNARSSVALILNKLEEALLSIKMETLKEIKQQENVSGEN